MLVNIKKEYKYFVKWHDDLYGMLYRYISGLLLLPTLIGEGQLPVDAKFLSWQSM